MDRCRVRSESSSNEQGRADSGSGTNQSPTHAFKLETFKLEMHPPDHWCEMLTCHEPDASFFFPWLALAVALGRSVLFRTPFCSQSGTDAMTGRALVPDPRRRLMERARGLAHSGYLSRRLTAAAAGPRAESRGRRSVDQAAAPATASLPCVSICGQRLLRSLRCVHVQNAESPL